MATVDTCVAIHTNRFLLIFVIHFPSYAKHLREIYTKHSSKHCNTKHLSARFRAS